MIKETVIAKQPIVNSNGDIVAFEFLNRRSSSTNSFSNTISEDYSSSLNLLNSFHTIGEEKLLDNKYGFFNITEEILLYIDGHNIPQNSILEVMEFDEVDQRLVDAIIHAKSKGYKIALDDFLYKHKESELIKLVDVIKIDYVDCTYVEIEEIMEKYQETNLVFLAEKVETIEDYNHANRLNFDLYQGYYFYKPELVSI